MIDFDKPVQTRDGRKVRILCTDGPGDTPIIGLVDGNSYPSIWKEGGKHASSPTDLVNVPETRVVWLNVEKNAVYPHDTMEDAIEGGTSHDRYEAIARVRVEYEVGQFDA